MPKQSLLIPTERMFAGTGDIRPRNPDGFQSGKSRARVSETTDFSRRFVPLRGIA
jgi:hypothetical protein